MLEHDPRLFLKKMGFIQTNSDPCLYTSSGIIAVYVDDILLATFSSERLEAVKKAISAQFEVKDLGELHYILGNCESKSRRKIYMDWSTKLCCKSTGEVWYERC